MEYFSANKRGQQEFIGGKEEWETAAGIAEECSFFIIDDEDELLAEEERSCYNCRYRRWTEASFVCLKK